MEELQKAFEEQASALSGAMKGVAIPPNQGVQSGREKSARIGEGAHRHRDIDVLSVPTSDLLTQFGISSETINFQKWYSDNFDVTVDRAGGKISIVPKAGKLPPQRRTRATCHDVRKTDKSSGEIQTRTK